MDSVPKGLSGSNITISVSDPKIAEITAVLIPDWGTLNRKSTAPSNSVWIEAVDVSKKVNPGDKNVLLGTITLTGKMVGTTNLSILPTEIDDDNGNPINPVVIAGNVHNTATGGSKKTPGFEIIYGLVSLLAVFLHKRK